MTGPIWESISKEAKNFISQLLEPDPTKRLDSKDALKNEWLNDTQDRKKSLNLTKQQLL